MQMPNFPNKFAVSYTNEGGVSIELPPKKGAEMTKDDAENLAAWLQYSAHAAG